MKNLPWTTVLAFCLLSGPCRPAFAQPTVNTLMSSGLTEPSSMVIEGNTIYLSDVASHRVLKYVVDAGLLTSLAGVAGQYGTNDGPGFLAKLQAPRGLVLYRGELVVADSGNHTLRKISIHDRVPQVSHLAGQPGIQGLPTDGLAAHVLFNNPVSLATDGDNIFIADSKNNVVRRLDANGLVSTIAGDLFEPAALALDPNGLIYVAERRNHAIKVLEPQPDGAYLVRHFAGSTAGVSGSTDAFLQEDARFNGPAALIWIGGDTGLLVSDSANHTIRRVFRNPDLDAFFARTVWSVETYGGIAGWPGLQDGNLKSALFNAPMEMRRDSYGGLIVLDAGNHALRRIQITPPKPQVRTPVIGYVTFITNMFGAEVSQLVPFTDQIFYNDEIIAVLQEPKTAYFNVGVTPGLFQPDTIPVPIPSASQMPHDYMDGMSRDQVPASMISPQPDLTIKMLAAAEGRQPSPLVQARAQFKVAPPIIIGDNPYSFVLRNDTRGAEMYYTLSPVPTGEEVPKTNNQAYFNGDAVTITSPDTFIFRVQAFKPNFRPSEIVTKTFSSANFTANRISFGFANGEASSQFICAAGQRFIAPVTLSLLPAQKMFSLQFNLQVTQMDSAPPVTGGAVGFDSFLTTPIPNTVPVVYRIVHPTFFKSFEVDEFGFLTGEKVFTNLMFTNFAQNLMGVGWLERYPETNLFDTTKFHLIETSQPHDRIFNSKEGKVVAGGYSFVVPPTAQIGQKYKIQVARASATADGVSEDVFIHAPTSGSTDVGEINSIKILTVASREYLAGDVAPFRWFNAGDFGDGSLLNNDALQIFQTAVYGMNQPPAGCDLLDAMDTSNGALNNLLRASDGNDLEIDNVGLGDGELNVDDIYVCFRRGLDPSLKNFKRSWQNGVRVAVAVPNNFRFGQPNRPAARLTAAQPNLPAAPVSLPAPHAPPAARVSVSDAQGAAGQVMRLPIRLDLAGSLPARVLMINLNVLPLDGSPPLTTPLKFTPAAALGQPAFSHTKVLGNYAAAWLDAQVTGIYGSGEVGVLQFAIPAEAGSQANYKIELTHFSASPNGLGLFPVQKMDGLISLGNRSQSSWRDGIPDAWRLRHFGSVSNWLSHITADADGDGVPNGEEFKAGTNPMDVRSFLRVLAARRRGGATPADPMQVLLKWPSIPNKNYALEWSTALAGQEWYPLAAPVNGTGWMMEQSDSCQAGESRFYRLRVLE